LPIGVEPQLICEIRHDKSFRLIAVRPQLILLFNNLEISDVLSG